MDSRVGIALFVLAGCAATPLAHDAAPIRLTNAEPGRECRYLGEVTGSQGDWWTGPFTSNARLEEGARNDLKNKAAVLGANVVQLVSSQSGVSAGGSGGGAQTTVVTYVGAAYRCPSAE